MSNPRIAKLEDQIHKIVARMLERRVKDPRLGFVTITEVRVTGDGREATIFYTDLGRSLDGREADAEGGVAQLCVAVQGHVALHAADVEQHLAGPGNQKTACRCRADVAAVPLEQAHAHLALQRLDAAAEGGLAQVHPLGRAREVAGVGQGQQMRQMP